MKLNVKRLNKIVICLWHLLYGGLSNTLPFWSSIPIFSGFRVALYFVFV